MKGNDHIMARMLGVLTLFTCAGRSLGPVWTPLLLKVQESIYQSPSCCAYIDGAVGMFILSFLFSSFSVINFSLEYIILYI